MHTTIYVPVWSSSGLIIQMLSFLTLFTGSSIVGLVPAFISGLVRRFGLMNQKKYVQQVLPKIRLTLILFSLAFLLSQTLSMVTDYKRNVSSPNRTNILDYSFELEPISLILCFPIELLIWPEEPIRKGKNSELLRANTFDQIEQLTKSGFNQMVKEISLYFGAKDNTENLRKELSDEVMFKNESFKCSWKNKTVTDTVLTRCFRLNLHVEELRHNKMVPFSFLGIFFQNPYWKIFITERNQKFHSQLPEIRGEYRVSKFVWSLSKYSVKSNCTDYREAGGKFGCESRGECLNRCINKRFLEKHHQISMHSVLNKGDYRPFLLPYLHFNDTKDPAIEQECLQQFEKIDCSGVLYVETLKPTYWYSENYAKLNLNFENSVDRDLEFFQLKLFLDILTLVCLVFSVNLTSILIQSFSVLKKIFRLRWYRMYGVIISLICLIGFLIHQFSIFKQITQRDTLKDDGHFKKLDQYQMPNSIMCFLFDKSKVDRNFPVTGRYLANRIASDLTYEQVFDRITYWNGSYLQKLKMNETEFINDRYSTSEIELTFFLFINMKCFEIYLKPAYREVDYCFFNNKVLLEVFFNERFTEKPHRDFVIFLYRKSGSKQFGFISLYRIGKARIASDHYHSYLINYELLEIERNDQFEFLKRPMSLFYETVDVNDVTNYIGTIKRKFTEQYRLATSGILVEDESELDLEHDDEFFKQFILQKQNKSDHFNPVSRNFRTSVYNTYAQADLM